MGRFCKIDGLGSQAFYLSKRPWVLWLGCIFILGLHFFFPPLMSSFCPWRKADSSTSQPTRACELRCLVLAERFFQVGSFYQTNYCAAIGLLFSGCQESPAIWLFTTCVQGRPWFLVSSTVFYVLQQMSLNVCIFFNCGAI